MRAAHVKFENPIHNYTTSINGTDEQIKNYFIGKSFCFKAMVFGEWEEVMDKCINVEIED